MYYKKLIHESWSPLLQPHFFKIDNFLQELRQSNIYFSPRYHEIFRSFTVPREKISVILIDYEPSLNPRLTDGRAFSSPVITKELQNIYEATRKNSYTGDLSYLEDQGILLLNYILTTSMENKDIHIDFWSEIIKSIILELSKESFIWLLWDKEVHFLSNVILNRLPVDKYNDKLIENIPITNYHNYVLKSNGPENKDFIDINHFQRVNYLLKRKGKKQINW